MDLQFFPSSYIPPNEEIAPVEVFKQHEEIYKGNWVGLTNVKWRNKADPQDTERVWECVYRRNKPPRSDSIVDGVAIVPILIRDGKKFIVLIKQWRIPVNNFCIEFPGGLMDTPNEDLETCALRELKEETGYTATKVLHVTNGIQCMDPGMSSSCVQFVTVHIDGDAEVNRVPDQTLLDGEAIEVLVVPLDMLSSTLREFSEQGFCIEAIVQSFAVSYATRPCAMLRHALRLLLKQQRGELRRWMSRETQEYLNQHWDTSVSRNHPNVQRLKAGLLAGDRAALAEAITLVDSRNPSKKAQGQILLSEMVAEVQKRMSDMGPEKSLIFRVAISGSPGVGKSSFIETFGMYLIEQQHKKVAVLTIDPSSKASGGSILGDIVRMPRLARNPASYIRSTPAQGALGGVAKGTREAMVLCEGAGYDLVLIETVGVGQSEAAVADMVDMFVLLISPAQGDELQGLKKGIVEMADLIVVTKADGPLLSAARLTQGEYMSALKYLNPRWPQWKPPVLRASAHSGDGVPEVWKSMLDFWQLMIKTDEVRRLRAEHLLRWMWIDVEDQFMDLFRTHPRILASLPEIEANVVAGKLSPFEAAKLLLVKIFAADS